MSGLSSFNCKLSAETPVDQDLLCPICLELIYQPVGLECGHSTCKECLETYIAKSSHGHKCSYCRHPIKTVNFKVNIVSAKLIAKYDVCCTNAGCTWKGKHGDMKDHWSSCPKMLMACPNGCVSQMYQRGELHQHMTSSCLYQPVPCQFCNAGVPRYYLDIHVENCQEIPRLCPLQCGEELPRSNIHLHLEVCPRRFTKCAVPGCSTFYAIGVEKDHYKEYQESHQVLLKNEVERLKGVLHDKGDLEVERVLQKRRSFRWTLSVDEISTGKNPATRLFEVDGNVLRCVWDRGSIPQRIFLEQTVSSRPLTVKPRFALIRDGKEEQAFEARNPQLITEDSAVSTTVDFPSLHDEGLVIKVTIAIYKHI